jgi:hypothetical protein
MARRILGTHRRRRRAHVTIDKIRAIEAALKALHAKYAELVDRHSACERELDDIRQRLNNAVTLRGHK